MPSHPPFQVLDALDTTPEAAAVQRSIWKRMGGERRVALAVEMSEEAREVSRDGIRSRHPDYSPHQVEMALRRLLLGDELVQAAWPDEPLTAP